MATNFFQRPFALCLVVSATEVSNDPKKYLSKNSIFNDCLELDIRGMTSLFFYYLIFILFKFTLFKRWRFKKYFSLQFKTADKRLVDSQNFITNWFRYGQRLAKRIH